LQDTTTPVKIGIYAVLQSIILTKTLMRPLKHKILAPATSLVAGFDPGLQGAVPGEVACDGGLRFVVHT
jgi:peptidoglycan biosynthesis protein MviN/MurJ (putative lipid II flippase)